MEHEFEFDKNDRKQQNIIVSFPCCPPSFEIHKKHKNSMNEFQFELKEDPDNSEIKTLIAKNQFIEYKGSNVSNTDLPQLSKYYVGILLDNKIKVLEGLGPIPLYPSVTKNEDTNDKQNLDKCKLNSKISRFEKKMKVVEDFGTKKSKAKMRALVANVVKEDSIANRSLLNSSIQIKSKEIDKDIKENVGTQEDQQTHHYKALLPPFNEQEENIELIYDYLSIISPEERNLIDIKWVKNFLDNPNLLLENREKLNLYILSRFEDLMKNYNERKLFVAMYLNYLLYFYFLPKKISQNFDILSKLTYIPTPLIKILLTKFTKIEIDYSRQTVYIKSKTMMDKLICFIIILMLHLENFSLKLGDIVKTLKLKPKKASTYLKVIGCFITKSSSDDTEYSLSCPIKFQSLKISHNKKRK